MTLRSGGNFAHDGLGDIGPFEETLTQQHQKDEADINVIVRRFGVTGLLPQVTRLPLDIEFGEIVDYQTAMNAIVAAKEAFMELPSEIRRTFNNDPHEFIEFAEDPENIGELRKMGLAPEVSNVEDSAALRTGRVEAPAEGAEGD